jgi:phospholipid/cholesterol/gamma-HCH transport system substrate-binding protein
MDERTLQIRVGVVVVTAAIIAFLLVFAFAERRSSFFETQKTIYLKFSHAPGVTAQTPVRKNGIHIGRVTDVQLLDEGGVVITAKLDDRHKVRRSEVVRISTASIIGDAVLEFVPSNEQGASNELIQDGEFIADGIVASDPLRVLIGLEDKLGGAIRSIEGAGNEVTLLARNMNTIVGNNQEQFQRVIMKSEQAMDRFRSAMTTVDELVGDPEVRLQLKQALAGVPQLMTEARTTLEDARRTLDGFQKMSERANTNLENLEQFTKPLAERGDKLVMAIESSVTNIDDLLDQLVQFGEALNNREGTLGQLMHDRDLYDRLQRTVTNVEDASRQLRPIMNDVRILTDKLATDPGGQIVKRALDRRPIGSGTKWSWGEPEPTWPGR